MVGAKVRVCGIDPLGRPAETGIETDNRLTYLAGFPLARRPTKTGGLPCGELPRDRVVSLFFVTEPHHERTFAYAATSEQPQPDRVSRRSRSGNPTTCECQFTRARLILTAKLADHVLIGRVVLEGNEKPAAKAVIIHDALVSNADDNGKFRIEGLVSGKLELHASAMTARPPPPPSASRSIFPKHQGKLNTPSGCPVVWC